MSNLYKKYNNVYLTKKQIIVIKKVAPLGDPIEIRVRGYELSLRKEDAKNIDVEVVEL